MHEVGSYFLTIQPLYILWLKNVAHLYWSLLVTYKGFLQHFHHFFKNNSYNVDISPMLPQKWWLQVFGWQDSEEVQTLSCSCSQDLGMTGCCFGMAQGCRHQSSCAPQMRVPQQPRQVGARSGIGRQRRVTAHPEFQGTELDQSADLLGERHCICSTAENMNYTGQQSLCILQGEGLSAKQLYLPWLGASDGKGCTGPEDMDRHRTASNAAPEGQTFSSGVSITQSEHYLRSVLTEGFNSCKEGNMHQPLRSLRSAGGIEWNPALWSPSLIILVEMWLLIYHLQVSCVWR